MLWHQLTDLSQLEHIQNISKEQPGNYRAVLIFKHSTRCGISRMSLKQLENEWTDSESIPCYFLDLLRYRNISDKIALDYNVEHESPQVLLIKNGKCIFNQSQNEISAQAILNATR